MTRGAPAERVRALLAAQGRPWPAPIEHFAVLSSTNDAARDRAKDGGPEWTAVLADVQTAGRGRQGRAWSSPPGNLFLSVVLRPRPPAPRWSVLPLLAGVAVADAAERLGASVLLKWPNDVLAGGERKVAGILVEATSGADGIDSAVVGVGVNVAVRPDDLPPDVREGTTSLARELGREVEVAEVAAAVLGRLAVWYDAFAREGAQQIRRAWHARAVPWWGRPVEARSGAGRLVGIARDVDEQGALVLELDDGKVVTLHSGDVRALRLSPEP